MGVYTKMKQSLNYNRRTIMMFNRLIFLIFTISILSGVHSQTPETFTVLIDPGHGGKDTGYVWKQGIFEKDIAFQYAKTLAQMLKEENIPSQFTRTSPDSFIPLEKRYKMTQNKRISLVVSLHVSAERLDTNSIALYYNPKGPLNRTLVQILKRHLEQNQFKVIVGNASFVILKNTNVPSVYVGLWTGKSLNDLQFFLNKDIENKICQALAKGIHSFLLKNK